MLREEGLASAGTADDLAMTVISMFDAGAKDAEVVAFLARIEGAKGKALQADPSHLKAFVGRLHRAAAAEAPEAAT